MNFATACFSINSLMSKRMSARSDAEKIFGKRPCDLGLADAGRAEEKKRADGPVGILQPGTRTSNRTCESRDRRTLRNDALVQLGLRSSEASPLLPA